MMKTRPFHLLFVLLHLLFLAALCAAPRVLASGSRDLFPASDEGKSQAARANLEWRTNQYGNLLLRRTLLHVYATAGEYILVGSSAVGVGSGDALIYNPGRVTGAIGAENVPATPDFQASSQSGKGMITSRAQELAGPQSADGTGNTSGYAPAYYVAPQTGIYSVVFYGPTGGSDSSNGNVVGDITLASANDFNSSQGDSVAAWDVTVRDSASSAADVTGRVFTYYLALFTGGNGRSLYGNLYAATTDGYQYQIALGGVDPNGFIVYGNQVGFYDSDGASPLYHDVLGASGQVDSIEGGCSLALPSYPLFFYPPATETLTAAGVATSPIDPVLSALSFSGTAGGNTSRYGSGGTFSLTSNLSAIYDIVISRDNQNFDPTLPANRRLRGVRAAGSSTVSWDGKDNSGRPFPVGTGYGVRATIHAGEYHFPLLDAENSVWGGPNVTLLNHANPGGAAHPVGFYDDRGYTTLSGYNVTRNSVSASGSASDVGQPLGGINPPSVINADPVNGFDMSSNQRTYGQTGSNGNTNTPNTGSFGDTKGLDLWTYFPSPAQSSTLNVQGAPTLLLVKRITAVNGVSETGFDDDPGTTDDNSPYWPAPASTYLRGARSVANVKPGDELEYTIYFVDTNGPASSITLADIVPTSTLFDAASYTGLTPTDGGPAGAASGIALALSASSLPTAPTSYLSNAADADRGAYDSAAAKVTVTLSSLPAATGSGSPTNSYGFLRFRVRVQ